MINSQLPNTTAQSAPSDDGAQDTLDAMSYEPLTPLSYLQRANDSHGSKVAVIDGDQRWTYEQLYDRAARLAGALAPLVREKPVAVMLPNSHVMVEAHFGVPWSGVPLVTINTRLAIGEVAAIIEHCEAAVLIYDEAFDDLARQVAAQSPHLHLIRVGDPYETLLAEAEPLRTTVDDERGVIAINYTSGTTGRPKGVMYHHRGAFLQALAMVGHMGLNTSTVYLWTLPMFHCNGWTFPWAVTAVAGTHVCLPKVDPNEVWRLLGSERVTHLCGAPTVLSMLAYANNASELPRPVKIATGGAPPSPAILREMTRLGFDVTHLYGLTETYGPAMICDWRPEWDRLPTEERARLKARQGVANMVACTARVITSDGDDVPHDGETVGEIALRGNNLMLGYLKDPEATAAVNSGGWFRTGDLGVMHPDGYVELRDRGKDVIISGGENIASVEVEQVIADHPAVLEVAVVAMPDDKWGEVPAAYVSLKPGASATDVEIREWVQARLARFKAPKVVLFTDLPKTSTGKIQKFVLRERQWEGREHRIQ